MKDMVSIRRKLNLDLSDILDIDLLYTDMIKPRRKLRDHHENSKGKMLAQEERSDLQTKHVSSKATESSVCIILVQSI